MPEISTGDEFYWGISGFRGKNDLSGAEGRRLVGQEHEREYTLSPGKTEKKRKKRDA